VSMRPKGLPQVPVQTASMVRAAFPQGSLAIRLCHRLHNAQLAAGSLELPGAVFAAPVGVRDHAADVVAAGQEDAPQFAESADDHLAAVLDGFRTAHRTGQQFSWAAPATAAASTPVVASPLARTQDHTLLVRSQRAQHEVRRSSSNSPTAVRSMSPCTA